MRSQTIATNPEHEAFYQDLCATMKRHGANLSAPELLAVASNLVGKLIAMQDQRTMTRERALEIVSKNLEAGNAQALAEVMASKGTA